MLTFVTVGTFQFDQLVQTVLSEAVLGALRERGYTELVVQCGKSDFELAGAVVGGNTVSIERNGVRVELWRSRESLDAEYRRADLVIGHAGAGTILEVLRLGKPLIVVPNPTLLHNHQTELAGALAPYLRTSSIQWVFLSCVLLSPTLAQRPRRHHRVLRPRRNAEISILRREQVPGTGGQRNGLLVFNLVLPPSIIHGACSHRNRCRCRRARHIRRKARSPDIRLHRVPLLVDEIQS